jgi:hypothetical protein
VRAIPGDVLKITVKTEPQAVAIKLEGAIAGNWVPELTQTWRSLEGSLDGKQVFIDLCDVTHVDDKGQKLLAEIYSETGASFLADRPLAQYFADVAIERGLKNKIKGAHK